MQESISPFSIFPIPRSINPFNQQNSTRVKNNTSYSQDETFKKNNDSTQVYFSSPSNFPRVTPNKEEKHTHTHEHNS